MFGPSRKRLEIERLQDAEAALTQRVAELEEENRLLTGAVERHRSDLNEANEKLAATESESGRLLLELERERALNEELREQLAESIDIEKEAAAINEKIDRVAKERKDFETKIANLQQTIIELRQRLGSGSSTPVTLDFSDLEEEMAEAGKRLADRRRPVGHAYRPSLPPTAADRDWLSDLPRF